MKNKIILYFFLFLLFLIAFILRAVLSTKINKGDIQVIEEWSRDLYQKGMVNSYFREGWVYSFPTQPPLMMLLYWFSRWFYEHRFYLSLWHNFFRLPPAFIITWFDKNGSFFMVKIWGILADLISAVLIYNLVKSLTKRTKTAFWSMFFILFNPLLVFESAIWGQVDMLGALFGFASFLLFLKRGIGKIISPVIFWIGIMLKPSILVLMPFYLIYLMKFGTIDNTPKKKILKQLFLGSILSLGLLLLSFLPFLDSSKPFLSQVKEITARRIVPSAKGVSKVATSAYNLYSLVFEIDKTPGSKKIAFLTLDQLGIFLVLLINILGGLFLFSRIKKEIAPKNLFAVVSFTGYFVGQGTFLFKTDMAERYFFPAFLFVWLFFFLVDDKKIKIAIILQIFIWFINLTSSFYLRDYQILNLVFRGKYFLGTRIISFFALVVFFFIYFTYSKYQYFTLKRNSIFTDVQKKF